MLRQSNTTIICLSIGFLLLTLISSGPILVNAQEEISFTLDRTFGTAFGNYIQGTFTLRGSAPSSVTNLTIYFDAIEVHFVEGYTISWQFLTSNYEPGSVNITLIGVEDTGEMHSTSRSYIFFDEFQTNLLTGGIITLVVVLIVLKYGSRLRKTKE